MLSNRGIMSYLNPDEQIFKDKNTEELQHELFPNTASELSRINLFLFSYWNK